MEIRKRTGRGKSRRIEADDPLKVVAYTPKTKATTLSFRTKFHDSEYALTLTPYEVRELFKDLSNIVRQIG